MMRVSVDSGNLILSLKVEGVSKRDIGARLCRISRIFQAEWKGAEHQRHRVGYVVCGETSLVCDVLGVRRDMWVVELCGGLKLER